MRLLAPTLVSLVLAACSSTPSTGSRIPDRILEAAEDRYPGQRIVFSETRASGSGRIHSLILDRDGLRTVVHFEADGTVRWERAEILPEEVPAAIRGSIRNRFPGADIPLAIRIVDGDRTTYELRLLDPAGITSSLELTPAGMIVEDIDGEGVPAPAPEER